MSTDFRPLLIKCPGDLQLQRLFVSLQLSAFAAELQLGFLGLGDLLLGERKLFFQVADFDRD